MRQTHYSNRRHQEQYDNNALDFTIQRARVSVLRIGRSTCSTGSRIIKKTWAFFLETARRKHPSGEYSNLNTGLRGWRSIAERVKSFWTIMPGQIKNKKKHVAGGRSASTISSQRRLERFGLVRGALEYFTIEFSFLRRLIKVSSNIGKAKARAALFWGRKAGWSVRADQRRRQKKNLKK